MYLLTVLYFLRLRYTNIISCVLQNLRHNIEDGKDVKFAWMIAMLEN